MSDRTSHSLFFFFTNRRRHTRSLRDWSSDVCSSDLDDLSTGDRRNLEAVINRVELIEGDVTDAETVRQAVRGCEVVYHQAALASVPRSVANPLATRSEERRVGR